MKPFVLIVVACLFAIFPVFSVSAAGEAVDVTVGGCDLGIKVADLISGGDRVQGVADVYSCPPDRRVRITVTQGGNQVPSTPRNHDYPLGTGGENIKSDQSNVCSPSGNHTFKTKVEVKVLSTGESLGTATGNGSSFGIQCL